jgi:hypothetical protein
MWLKKYFGEGELKAGYLFNFPYQKWDSLWKTASKVAGIKITPKVLCVWFSMEIGEQGIPDRFVDIFQGRAPRLVLAKHYTPKEVELLKRIYERANLNIMG